MCDSCESVAPDAVSILFTSILTVSMFLIMKTLHVAQCVTAEQQSPVVHLLRPTGCWEDGGLVSKRITKPVTTFGCCIEKSS